MGYIGQAPANKVVTSADIEDGVVSAADLAANSVDSSELVDGGVDLSHMSSESVDEDNLKISNAGSNGQFLSKQSGNTGGLTWAAAGADFDTAITINESGNSVDFRVESNSDANCLIVDGSGDKVGMGLAVPEGKLHIFTADASVGPNGDADELVIENGTSGSGVGISLLSATNGEGRINFGDSGDDNIGEIFYNHADNSMRFTANAVERMRLNSDGSMAIGSTSTTHGVHLVHDTTNYVMQLENSSSGVIYGLKINFKGNDTDDNVREAIKFSGGTGGPEVSRAAMFSDGDWQNHDNSYGSLSDERIKEDITDANSQWDDIKALRVRNFKKKDDVRKYGEAAWKQIGLIAQELELVSPKLIKECDPDTADIQSSSEFGTLYTEQDNIDGLIPEDKIVGNVKEITDTVKKISYSVLYMKAIKCLQEAQTRIETLETSNTDLTTRLEALENA